jgi:hypothetical protein
MGEIGHSLRRPFIVGLSRPVTPFSIFVSSTFRLFVSLFVGVAAMTFLIRVSIPVQKLDPFAAYADIFPGHLGDIRVLETKGYSCRDVLPPARGDVNQTCLSNGKTEQVSTITVAISDGTVTRLDFRLRDGALTLGDLVLEWGAPEIQMSAIGVRLLWRAKHISALGNTNGSGFTYFESALWLSFEL